MPVVTMRELLEAGVHYGHHTSRWNPKMKPYIYQARHSIHVIDLRQTVRGLVRARRFLTGIVEQGGQVILVGTKKQARGTVKHQADRAGIPYVCERWLGGALTNFGVIMDRIKRLNELEELQASGAIESRGKKYAAVLRRELAKLQKNLGGIRYMNRPPDAMIIIDPRRERNALREAMALDIPTICVIDTDSDPDDLDIAIPANDDALRSIQLICSKLMDAIIEGRPVTDEAVADEQPEAPADVQAAVPATPGASEPPAAPDAPPPAAPGA